MKMFTIKKQLGNGSQAKVFQAEMRKAAQPTGSNPNSNTRPAGGILTT